MAKKLFDINMDDVVKAGELGYYYVTTTPPHPHGEKRDDRNKKYIYLHRAVIENHLGRYLKPEEQVNHKDGDKSNNNLSNLELTERGPHQRDHAKKDNHFWEKSPLNKPKKTAAFMKKAAFRVITSFFNEKY